MNMNGREVVVIDSELFSQILDEIQFLKMKLSQLTEVIEVNVQGFSLSLNLGPEISPNFSQFIDSYSQNL